MTLYIDNTEINEVNEEQIKSMVQEYIEKHCVAFDDNGFEVSLNIGLID